jgi:hypothetical protein
MPDLFVKAHERVNEQNRHSGADVQDGTTDRFAAGVLGMDSSESGTYRAPFSRHEGGRPATVVERCGTFRFLRG